MKLSNRMIEALNKFGEYDTPKYRYYIGTDKGKEYIKRIPVRCYTDGSIHSGKIQNVKVWRGESWSIF